MKVVSITLLGSKLVKSSIILASLTMAQTSFAAITKTHYKNILIGGRASTMGGAYTAVSDDVTGSYYNPAGMSYASGGSISGSGNLYNMSKTTYKQAIASYDWERENKSLIPNFIGMLKKYGKHSFGLSYVIPDSEVEHQDQVYRNFGTNSIYSYNLHTEDITYDFGPSYAFALNDNLSFGLTLNYHYKIFRSSFHYLLQKNDGTGDEVNSRNDTYKEHGIRAVLGAMASLNNKLSLGFSVAKTSLLSAEHTTAQDYKIPANNNHTLATNVYKNKRKTPIELTLGAAFFPSAFTLFAFDFSYVLKEKSTLVDVWNIAAGVEHYLTPTNALRFGIYTNNTNQPEVSSATSNITHLDMKGVSLGYTNYNRESSITVGAVYSKGSGEAQIYNGLTASRDIDRSSLALIISSSYGI